MDVNVTDYGAVGNDIADDTAAFRNALNAIRPTGGTCFVSPGTYKIAPSGIMGGNQHGPSITDDMHLVGTRLDPGGRPSAFLHVHAEATDTIILCSGNHWSIEKLGLDMSGFYGTARGASPITVISPLSAEWKIDTSWIINTGKVAAVLRGSHFTVSNNYVLCTYAANTGGNPKHNGFLTDKSGLTYPSYGKYLNNKLDGVGFGGLGNHHYFRGNDVKRAGYGASYFIGGTLASPGNSHSNIFIGNKSSLTNEGIDEDFGTWSQVRGWEIYTPYSLFFNNISHDNAGSGFAINGSRSVVAFNTAYNNGRATGNPNNDPNRPGFAFGGLTAHHFVSGSNTLLFNNISKDTRAVGSKTQTYGIEILYNWIKDISVIGNYLHGNSISEGLYRSIQPNVSIAVGRDLFRQLCDARQQDMLKSLFSIENYIMPPGQYDRLNELLK